MSKLADEYSSNLHPSIHINNQHKLEAKHHIFQYEILGRFIGDEMFETEFNEVSQLSFCCKLNKI